MSQLGKREWRHSGVVVAVPAARIFSDARIVPAAGRARVADHSAQLVAGDL